MKLKKRNKQKEKEVKWQIFKLFRVFFFYFPGDCFFHIIYVDIAEIEEHKIPYYSTSSTLFILCLDYCVIKKLIKEFDSLYVEVKISQRFSFEFSLIMLKSLIQLLFYEWC